LTAFGEPALAAAGRAVRAALLDPPPRFTLHLPNMFAQIGPRAAAANGALLIEERQSRSTQRGNHRLLRKFSALSAA